MRLWRISGHRVAVFSAAAIVAFSFTLSASGARPTPTFTAISAGFAHTCAVTRAGGAKCWGGNAYGEVGNGGGSLATALSAVDVKGLTSGVRAIGVGGQHSCAVTRAGGAKCWGQNHVGEVGRPATPSGRTPVAVAVTRLGSGVKAIAAGS